MITAKVISLAEIKTVATRLDVLAANEVLDAIDEARAVEAERNRPKKSGGGR